MKRLAVKNGTSHKARFIVKSQSTGLGVPSLVYNTSGVTVYYHRAGDTSSTAVTLCAGTLGTYTNQGGTGTGGGWVAIDGTGMPGLYEFSCPDAMWAGGEPILNINVPAGDFCEPCEYQLTGADFSASLGGTNALLAFGVSTGQINPAGGVVPANVTQAFPPHFSTLAINASTGRVGIDGSLSPVVRNLDAVTVPTYDDCLVAAFSEAVAAGTETETSLVTAKPDGSGPLRSLTVTRDGNGNVTGWE